jgi:predicted Fe-Mo cluster-binding NifX family protein
MNFEVFPNPSISSAHGAGISAAQAVANKDVKAIITGNIGPNAYQALSSAGIKIFTGVTGTVKEAIEKYKSGELKETNQPTTPAHSGLGNRVGLGLGGGMGMGRGKGRGQNMAFQATTPSQQVSPSKPRKELKPEDELIELEEYKKRLEDDLQGLQARIKELKRK